MAKGFSLIGADKSAGTSRDVALKEFNSDYVKLRIEEHRGKLAENRERREAERREKFPELYMTRWERFKASFGSVRDPESQAHQSGLRCCAACSLSFSVTAVCVVGILVLVIITVLSILWKYKALLLAI